MYVSQRSSGKTLRKNLDGTQFKCQYMSGLSFYDLQPIEVFGPPFLNFTDDRTGAQLLVSFCKELPDDLWCKPGYGTMAVIRDAPNKGDCIQLSGDDPTKNAKITEKSPTSDDGVYLNFNGGDPNYNLTMDIQCLKGVPYEPVGINAGDGKNITVSFKSQVGCRYDQLSDIWNWFQNNRWAMFAAFVIIGFTLCFAGRALVRPTLFLTGVMISCFVIMYIFYSTFLKKNTETWVVWAVLGGSILVGLILGFIF